MKRRLFQKSFLWRLPVQHLRFVCPSSAPPPTACYCYDAWTEVFPLQPSQVLPNLPVHPGDTIECAVWISSDNLIPTLTGGFAYFDLFNITTNQTVRTVFEIAQKFNFLGHDAEWIVERPSIGPTPQTAVPTDLSNYHSVCSNNSNPDYQSMLMSSPLAWAETGANQYNKFPYTGFANDSIAMVSGNILRRRRAR